MGPSEGRVEAKVQMKWGEVKGHWPGMCLQNVDLHHAAILSDLHHYFSYG